MCLPQQMRYEYFSFQVDQYQIAGCFAQPWNYVYVLQQNFGLPSVDIYLNHDVATRGRLDGATNCDSHGQIACVLVLQRKSGTTYVVHRP